MKTLEQFKEEILAANPSRQYVINDETFEQTEEEFLDAVAKKAESLLEKQQLEIEQQEAEAKKQALLDRLGITAEEARLLLS